MLLSAFCIFAAYSYASASAEVLLDEKWTDGSRGETKLPAEAAVWVGRKADVQVAPGTLTTHMGAASQKLWLYFTDKEPVELAAGEKLVATVTFVPRGALNEGAPRGLRVGLFNDPTSPRVEADVNSDIGGKSAPWADAKGYAVVALLAGGEPSVKPFDLGKRTNMKASSLLGVSGDFTKATGGEPTGVVANKPNSLVIEVEKTSDKEVKVTASYRQDSKTLSTWSVTDDGQQLGRDPICDAFDLLFIRIGNKETTAETIDFTNIKVERVPAKSPQQKAA